MFQDDSHLDPAEDSEHEDVLYSLPAARGPRGRLGSVPTTGRPRERITNVPMAGRLRGPLDSHPTAGRPASTEEGSGRENATEGFDNQPLTNRPVSPAAGLPRREDVIREVFSSQPPAGRLASPAEGSGRGDTRIRSGSQPAAPGLGRENIIREIFGSRPPSDRPPRASPAEGSEGEDSTGRGERFSSKPVADRFVSPDEGSVPESEDIRGFFSNPSPTGGAVSVYSNSTGQGPRSPEGGTDGGSIIAPRPRRPAPPISIMARMNSAKDYHVTQPPSVASDNDVARHGIRKRGHSIFKPEGLAVQGGSPTFRAYKLAPPRVGPGFDNRPAPQPPGGSHARSWLFAPPHRIADEEAQSIVKLYEDMYEYSESTRASTLPTEYRYPPPRDEAARQRKEDFEARTGETMSDADFYALFDLETSTDGMISGLLEWMQGRVWVKVPFVNRIIHQIGRLMFTSAQEETRLRTRWREECERLKQTLEGYEKRQAEERRAAGLDVNGERAKKMRRIRELWKRINDLIVSEEGVIRENMGRWLDEHEVNERMMSRITVWEEMYEEFTNLLDERDRLEEVIEARPQVWTEDLERLSVIGANIERAFLRFVEWEMKWSTNLISWIQGGVEDTNGATLLRDVHKSLTSERRLLKKDLLEMKGIAEMQRTARMYRAKSKNDDQRESTPGDAADPPECRAKCRALEQEVADLKRRLRESERKAKSMTRQRDEARSALDRVTDGDVETALGHTDSYRNLIHTEMYDAMGYLSEMLESVGSRVQEQTSLFQSSLDYLARGGDPRHIAEDLRSLNHSTQIMSESTLLIQGRLAEYLDGMEKHKKTCYGHIEKEDPYDRERREGLISSMRAHIEDIEEQQTGPNLAQSVEQLKAQMKAKNDELRARTKLLKQLERRRDQQDGEGNFGRKATEKIEELQAEIEQVKIETLGLRVQLEERNESQAWTPWDGVPTTAAGPDPDGRRAQQVVELRKRLLEAVVRTQMAQVDRNKRKTSLRGVLKSAFKNCILPKNHRGERRRSGQNETTETTMDDLATFWRLASFQRVRGEIVAALRLGDWATAISQLDDAREWQQQGGTWKPDDYGHEISRSINYLRAYAHMMRGEFLRQSGRESESLGMFTHARGCLTNARNVPRTTPSPEPWVALRSYLEKQAEKSAELVKRQGSKPKTKASQERQKDAQVVGTTSLGSQAERERGRRRKR
ncbi:hypothetical protein CMUS01_00720 [Colletotrichum musicola]|uniref:Uncharacterized protein n=1 Tax=Colletotrichum musicola TaxID=2175873 RepID=A0A8H6NYC3_9PEZI|nr:hypothetical protein CMUS01_00720 [Colletotrichum musicola]